MKIFGTISPWVEIEDKDLKMGRYIANNDFLRALFLYTDFDEYHFYVFNKHFLDITLKYFKKTKEINSKLSKIKIFQKKDLIKNIKNIEYYIFHQGGWYVDMPTLIYIRNKYAKKKFPITGIIHSINNFNTLIETIKFISSPYTCKDAIFATSNSGKNAMVNYFSEASKKTSIKKDPPNMPIIPLGYNIDLEQTNDNINMKDARKILNLPTDKFTILFLGRLSLSTKLDIANMLFQLKKYITSDNFTFILAGGGTQKDKNNLDQIIKEFDMTDKIKIFFNFKTETKEILYKASNIFLSPVDNLQETFGITIPEAKFFGTVPIASNWDGYKDTIRDNNDGFLIPTFSTDKESDIDQIYDLIGLYDYHYYFEQTVFIDYKILREKIDLLYNNPAILKKFSMRAKSHAKKFYSWKNIINQYEIQWEILNNNKIKEYEDPEQYLKLNFRNIFNSHYTDFKFEKIYITDEYKSNLEVLKKMHIAIFIDFDIVIKLIDIAKKKPILFKKLNNNEKNISLILLKWNILKISDK